MLNSHMKSHTNVYQYRCADCTYATKYCHSLKLHLQVEHILSYTPSKQTSISYLCISIDKFSVNICFKEIIALHFRNTTTPLQLC